MSELAQQLGVNLRRCRERAGMSLGEVAAAAGLAKSTLHALEQGDGNPTLATVWALATTLGVPLGELLEEGTAGTRVIRAADVSVIEGDSVHARLMQRVQRGVVEVYAVQITTAEQVSAPHRPGVRELLLVTDGVVRAGPADDPVELAAGDAALFEASSTHGYAALGRTARAVLLMIYP